jgi:hypothetical protein
MQDSSDEILTVDSDTFSTEVLAAEYKRVTAKFTNNPPAAPHSTSLPATRSSPLPTVRSLAAEIPIQSISIVGQNYYKFVQSDRR